VRCCLTGNDVSSRLVVLCHQHKHNNIYKMIEQQQPPGKPKKKILSTKIEVVLPF
jgi:hypothetical protein